MIGEREIDGFEALTPSSEPAELEALFEELRAREGPVELILAGDFFDFLPLSNRHDLPERPCSDPWDRREDSLDTLVDYFDQHVKPGSDGG